MPRRYWLMKCEPDAYTIDDLARDKAHELGGRAQLPGAQLHARRDAGGRRRAVLRLERHPSGVTGSPRVVREGYPDHTAWTKGHTYFDEASTKDAPVWYMVDIGFVERFPAVVPLETLKRPRGLEKMMVTQKGSRLSVQPVTKAEYDIVVERARR
jgi:predicted RNA-binding protein with PUA-like domain